MNRPDFRGVEPKYPAIAQGWRRNWEAIIQFFASPADVHKIIYTTNAIESLNTSVRKAIRDKGHFSSDQAATKLIWLALRHITENWKRPPVAWQAAKAPVRATVRRAVRFQRLRLTGSYTQNFRQAPIAAAGKPGDT